MAGVMVVFGLTAVLALVWAIRSGQFERVQQGAYVIFDEDEKGQMTDTFPDRSDAAAARGEATQVSRKPPGTEPTYRHG